MARPTAETGAAVEEMARALSGLYAAGAVLVGVSLLIPGWSGREEFGLAVPALIAGVVSVALWMGRRRLGSGPCAVLTAAGSVLIWLATEAAGPAAPSFALFFVWVSLYSFYWFTPRVALAQWMWSALLLAPLMANKEGPADLRLARWVLTSGTSLAAGLVVGRLARQLRQTAQRDWLTGAVNRRGWEQALEASWARSKRSARPLSVALVDLGQFKELNDRDGHAAGDATLQRVAAAWRKGLRADDVLARLGGDEFGVILGGCSPQQAATVIEQIRGTTADDEVTCSVGIAGWDGRSSTSALLHQADLALYQAKATGRNRVVVFSGTGARPAEHAKGRSTRG